MRHSLSFSDLRPLIDLEGHEQCGFLVGTEHRICALWPTPSLRPSETRYSIGREAWEAARARSAREGVTLLGSLHTHPSGPVGPSDLDLLLARRLRQGEIRATWHPRSGTLTLYGRAGITRQEVLPRPWWFRLIAPIFFC